MFPDVSISLDSHLRNCPSCADGGRVTTYDTDREGRATTYICTVCLTRFARG